MNVACVQLDIAWENPDENFSRVRRLLDRSSIAAESLVLLPEMFSTGFSMNVTRVSDSAGTTRDFCSALARQHGVYLLAGLVTGDQSGRGRNEAVVFAPDGNEIDRYCKMHPFTPGGESANYLRGNAPILFDWHGCKVAPLICYDLRFPEVFRAAVRRGAQLFAVIANWPAPRIEHWVTLLKARAIENQAYVAGCNRCGDDPKLSYPGRSLVIDPRGHVLADAGDAETIIQSPIDLETLTTYRHELPFLADMRDDLHASR